MTTTTTDTPAPNVDSRFNHNHHFMATLLVDEHHPIQFDELLPAVNLINPGIALAMTRGWPATLFVIANQKIVFVENPNSISAIPGFGTEET